MRTILCHVVMLSVLFMSLEGAIDIVSQGHPHSDDPAQQLDSSSSVVSEKSANTDSTPDSDNCEHCCHGHVASFVMEIPRLSILRTIDQATSYTARVVTLPEAPPTPPPNA